MELTITRASRQKGILNRRTAYYLGIEVTASPEELECLRCDRDFMIHEKVCTGTFDDYKVTYLTLYDILGKNTSWCFSTVDHLVSVESQLIESLKGLRHRLGLKIEDVNRRKQQAADFTSEGPHKVEL